MTTMNDNVFGLPVNAISREEAAAVIGGGEVTFYAVMRCEDLPAHHIPGPVRDRNQIIICPDCDKPCWIDPESHIPGVIIRCTHCLPEQIGPINVLDTVADEVRGYE